MGSGSTGPGRAGSERGVENGYFGVVIGSGISLKPTEIGGAKSAWYLVLVGGIGGVLRSEVYQRHERKRNPVISS